jgi:hypothetical protein
MPINLINTVAIADSNITQDKLASGVPSATNITAGTLPRARLPAGTVLQVVQGTISDFSTTSTSFSDCGSVTITPISASSKILIMYSGHCRLGGGSYTRTMLGVRILRDSTTISNTAGSTETMHLSFASGQISEADQTVTKMELDSPNTTSQITYKVQMARGALGGTVYAFPTSFGSRIIAMEFAG